MSEQDSHSSFIRTPQQLVLVVLLGFVVPVIAIVLLVQLVVNRPRADAAAMAPQAVAERIQPVGRVSFTAAPADDENKPAAASAAGKAGPADGKKVYGTACVACHATGAANAPKFGDKAAWAPRIKTGAAALLKSALGGKGAMPAKGGNAALSEAEVRAAVEYMIAGSR